MLTLNLANKLISKCCSCNIQNIMNHNVLSNIRKYGNNNKDKTLDTSEENTKLGDISSKYAIFKENECEIILDVNEEKLLKYENLLQEEVKDLDPFEGINLNRGKYGVFDIQDLVEVLKRENARNIFVAEGPPEIKYVDYICVVSGKSRRHLQAIAQYVRRVYKQKRHRNDLVPKLEGEHSKDWMALDLGNIALHIFSKEARIYYDLDSLWAVGPKFDKEYNKEDPVVQMLEKHTIYLHDLQPAS